MRPLRLLLLARSCDFNWVAVRYCGLAQSEVMWHRADDSEVLVTRCGGIKGTEALQPHIYGIIAEHYGASMKASGVNGLIHHGAHGLPLSHHPSIATPALLEVQERMRSGAR